MKQNHQASSATSIRNLCLTACLIGGGVQSALAQGFPESCTGPRADNKRLVELTLSLHDQQRAGMDSPDYDIMAKSHRKKQAEAYCSPIRQRIEANKKVLNIRIKFPNCFRQEGVKEFTNRINEDKKQLVESNC